MSNGRIITISLTIQRNHSNMQRNMIRASSISHSQSVSGSFSYNRRSTRNHTSLRINTQSSRKRRSDGYSVFSSSYHRLNRFNLFIQCENEFSSIQEDHRRKHRTTIHRLTQYTIRTQTINRSFVVFRTSNRRYLSMSNGRIITISLTIQRNHSNMQRNMIRASSISHSQSVSGSFSYNRRSTRNHTSLRINTQSSRKRRSDGYTVFSSSYHRLNRSNRLVHNKGELSLLQHNDRF